jgi:hypothetical protein
MFNDFIQVSTESGTNLLQNQTFLNAVGAAAGGFLGVFLFFLVRLVVEKIRSRRKFIRQYSCAHDQNIGDANEYEGQLMHHHGERVTDENELEKISRHKPVWEWNRRPCGKGQGTSIIYGPYTTDFSEPGEYEVSFRIKGFGISKQAELTHDPIILELDVTRSTPELIPTPGGIAALNSIITVSRHFVRASDLARRRWAKIRLRFYATGEGVWEYRVFAYDGVSKSPDNIAHFGQSMRLFFDTVTIKRIRKMLLPWG